MNPKNIRKQVRNVAEALMSEALATELREVIRKEMMLHIDKRLDAISAHLKSTLDAIDQRQRDVQAYTIRQSASMLPIMPDKS